MSLLLLAQSEIALIQLELFQLRNPTLKAQLGLNGEPIFYDSPAVGMDEIVFAVPAWGEDHAATNRIVIDYDLSTKLATTPTPLGQVWTITVSTNYYGFRVAETRERIDLDKQGKLALMKQAILVCALEVARRAHQEGYPPINDHAHL